jgi:hypothetical protein
VWVSAQEVGRFDVERVPGVGRVGVLAPDEQALEERFREWFFGAEDGGDLLLFFFGEGRRGRNCGLRISDCGFGE